MTTDELSRVINSEKELIAHSIVEQWRQIAESEVWHSLPPQMSYDDLPNVLAAIATAGLAPKFEDPALADILRYSALHGDHRNTEGFQEGFIYTEYHLLRRSLWQYVRERLDANTSMAVITRIDAAISLATMAGLRGFHCRTFEERGDWPAARDRLLSAWPLRGP